LTQVVSTFILNPFVGKNITTAAVQLGLQKKKRIESNHLGKTERGLRDRTGKIKKES